IYSTTNPGGIGHAWYRTKFVTPYFEHQRALSLSAGGEGRGEVASHLSHSSHSGPSTLFIPARVTDNMFNNPEYTKVLEGLTGWQKRAWLDGDWDIAAGQFFTIARRVVHVR